MAAGIERSISAIASSAVILTRVLGFVAASVTNLSIFSTIIEIVVRAFVWKPTGRNALPGRSGVTSDIKILLVAQGVTLRDASFKNESNATIVSAIHEGLPQCRIELVYSTQCLVIAGCCMAISIIHALLHVSPLF